MKRFISALLAFILMISLAVPAFAADSTGFTDVAAGAWYADAVSFVQDRGLMAGTGSNRFSPNQPTTRAMLVTILYRSAGSPAVSGSAGFSDVRQGYYTDAVNWAAMPPRRWTGPGPTASSAARGATDLTLAGWLPERRSQRL